MKNCKPLVLRDALPAGAVLVCVVTAPEDALVVVTVEGVPARPAESP